MIRQAIFTPHSPFNTTETLYYQVSLGENSQLCQPIAPRLVRELGTSAHGSNIKATRLFHLTRNARFSLNTKYHITSLPVDGRQTKREKELPFDQMYQIG